MIKEIFKYNSNYLLAMASYTLNKKVKNQTERYKESQNTATEVLSDGTFKVSDKVKSEYDMWVWIFQEIANLRLEVSRLGSYVRINNKNSPNYLDVYHSHIYSLLIPLSTIVPDKVWKKIDDLWIKTKKDINLYKQQRTSNPTKKIPFELIRDLDLLYRVALLAAQKAGLGIRVSHEQDIDKAIENSITGS